MEFTEKMQYFNFYTATRVVVPNSYISWCDFIIYSKQMKYFTVHPIVGDDFKKLNTLMFNIYSLPEKILYMHNWQMATLQNILN